jgi:putative ABC transport system permease protein
VRENAVLQTVGYPGWSIGFLVASEGVLLGLVGGGAGVLASAAFLAWQNYTVGNEGLTLAFVPSASTVATGLATALALGLLASLFPAWRAARQPLVASLRSA